MPNEFIARNGLIVSGSGITGSLFGTASYALTASYISGGGGGSGAGFPYSGSAVITGSLLVSGSMTVTGSLYAQNLVVTNIISQSSYSITGSVGGNIVTDALIYGTLISTASANQNDWSPVGWNDADPNKAVTIAISGSTSIIITGLAGGSDGRIAVIKNISPDYIVILEDYSLLSTAANRFDFRNPVFLTPNGSITLQYDGYTSRWLAIASSGGIGFGSFFNQWDDFMGGTLGATAVASGVWSATFSGTGASVAVSAYSQSVPGRALGTIQVTTGTTAAGRANIGANQNTIITPGQGQAMSLSRIALQQTSSVTNPYLVYSGWHNGGTNASASNGLYWQYFSSQSLNTSWAAVAASSSISQSVTTSAAISYQYIWLGIHTNSTWTKATYFYSTSSNSTEWTIAAVLSGSFFPPTQSSTGYGTGIYKISGAVGQLLSVDLLAHRYDISRG